MVKFLASLAAGLSHNGGTGGYRSFMAFDPKSGAGVVVLSHVGDELGVEDIGMHMLTGGNITGLVLHQAGRDQTAPRSPTARP